MPIKLLDCTGLRCPQPTLKITAVSSQMKPGDVLEVTANCGTFENDVRDWCTRAGKLLLWVKDEENGRKRVQIRF